jgi:hypothetical protein
MFPYQPTLSIIGGLFASIIILCFVSSNEKILADGQ